MTTGESRVGISFNPSGSDEVASIKQKAAELIDLIEAINPPDNSVSGSLARLASLAMDSIEAGAMWAVKAATLGK